MKKLINASITFLPANIPFRFDERTLRYTPRVLIFYCAAEHQLSARRYLRIRSTMNCTSCQFNRGMFTGMPFLIPNFHYHNHIISYRDDDEGAIPLIIKEEEHVCRIYM